MLLCFFSNIYFCLHFWDGERLHAWIQRGGTGGPGPPEKTQKYRVPYHTVPDPLKITKLPSQHSMLGHRWHASETVLWRADDGPISVVFGSTHQFKKSVVKVGPTLKKLSGSKHGLEVGLNQNIKVVSL